MLRRTFGSRAQFSVASLLGIVCIALVLMSGMIQVAHSHPLGQPDHDCSLCTTAHHVIQVVALVTLDLSSRPVTAVAPEPTRELPHRTFFFKLSSRPPPAVPAFA
jgi:hypothetical protein